MSTETDRVVPLRTGSRSAEPSGREGRWLGLAAVGGLLGGLGAVACCILPLVLFSLGVGGVWLGRLVALEAYQPLFVAIALGSIALGYGLAWQRRRAACGDGVCAPRPGRLMHVAFAVSLLLVAAGLSFPYLAPALLGI